MLYALLRHSWRIREQLMSRGADADVSMQSGCISSAVRPFHRSLIELQPSLEPFERRCEDCYIQSHPKRDHPSLSQVFLIASPGGTRRSRRVHIGKAKVCICRNLNRRAQSRCFATLASKSNTCRASDRPVDPYPVNWNGSRKTPNSFAVNHGQRWVRVNVL